MQYKLKYFFICILSLFITLNQWIPIRANEISENLEPTVESFPFSLSLTGEGTATVIDFEGNHDISKGQTFSSSYPCGTEIQINIQANEGYLISNITNQGKTIPEFTEDECEKEIIYTTTDIESNFQVIFDKKGTQLDLSNSISDESSSNTPSTDESYDASFFPKGFTGFGKSKARAGGWSVSRLEEFTWANGAGSIHNGRWTLSNGSYAFCGEALNASPAPGTPTSEPTVYDNSNVRKALYYGFGGPGDILTSQYGEAGAVVLTNEALSNAYCGTCISKATYNGYHWNLNVGTIVNSIYGMPDPIQYGYVAYRVEIAGTGTNWQGQPSPFQDLFFINPMPTGELQISKKSYNPEITDGNSCYSLEGAEYGIFTDSNATNRIDTLTIGKDNTSNIVKNLKVGTYYVKETKAPEGYALDQNIYPVQIESGKLTTREFTDYPQSDPISILLGKVDKDTNLNKPQGSASLAGAEFTVKFYKGIYKSDPALQNIKPDKTFVFATDEDGFISIDEEHKVSGDDFYYNSLGLATFPLGTLTIQETKAPTGYYLNSETFVRTITSEGNDESVYTYNQPIVKEEVLTGEFELVKTVTDGDSSEIVTNEKGAEFVAVLETDYVANNKDIQKALEYAKKNRSTQEYAVLTTNKEGHAASGKLAFGKYVIQQTKRGTNAEETDILEGVFTFEVYEENGKAVVRGTNTQGNALEMGEDGKMHYHINNRPSDYYLKLIKVDEETDKQITLSNAVFKVKNLDTDKYVSQKVSGVWVDEFSTNNNGYVILPLKLEPGNYQLEEIKAPEGYLLNSKSQPFVIKRDQVGNIDSDGDSYITVSMENVAVKGTISIEKNGEVLTSIKKDDEGNIQFIYKDAFLAGATYNIYANEDILDPADGSVLFKKDTLMDTVTITEEGKAISKKLPLGKYYVIEKKAPHGFIISEEKHEVELLYKDQNTEVVFDETSFHNERQKIALNILKEDGETHTALAGAVFDLYTKNDIKDNKGNILVKSNELIERSTSNEDGKLIFKADFPLDQYYIKEIRAPIGYASTDEVFEFDGSYQGQDVHTIIYNKTFENKIIKVEVSKKDITNDEEIAGAFLTVYPKDDEGAVFDSWISGQDGVNEDGTIKPHMIKGLEVGKTYILKEISSPHGYALAQDVEFTIGDTGEIQKVEMKDELVVGQLKWRKSGEIFDQVITGQTEFGKTESPVWNKSNLLGAKITIYAAEDIKIGNHTYYKANEEIQTLESDWDYVFSKELPVGRYYYKETTTPHGYIVDTNKHFFEIEDNQINEIQIIESTLKNERPTFDIDMTKVLEEQEIFKDEDAYKDIVFGIFAREDIYDYMGNVAIEHGTMISTTGITKEGHLETVPDLPNGVYFIKELATNDQYVLNDTEYDFEIGYKGQDISHYVVTIGLDGKIPNELARGDIYVQKKDSSDPDKVMKDVKFNISIHEDMSEVIQSSKTEEKGIASFKDLELGTYYIQEAKQVDGYVINDHIYKVEIKQDGDVLTIVCENKPTEMEFSKVDITTGKELPGAKMQVTDKETGKIIDEWVSTNEPHKIKYLVEGKEYILTEKIAPKGYELAESITFTAKDGLKITMKDKLIPEIPNTGNQTNLGLWLGLSGISLLAVMAFLARKRKKDDLDEK